MAFRDLRAWRFGRAVERRAEVYVTPIRGVEAFFCGVRRFDEHEKPPNGGQTQMVEIQIARV
jgi:hypothetical protein